MLPIVPALCQCSTGHVKKIESAKIVPWQLNTAGKVYPNVSRSAGILCPDAGNKKKTLTFLSHRVYDYNILLYPVPVPGDLLRKQNCRDTAGKNRLDYFALFGYPARYIYYNPFSSGSGCRTNVTRRSPGDYRGQTSRLP